MKVLVVGGGGREHALVWKIAQSPEVDKIYCAPGNGGIRELAECVPISDSDIDGLLKFADEKHIDLTIVGPEIPLTLGIVDVFQTQGLRIFGPSQKAAELEGSKVFSKYVMEKYHIPTAAYRTFDNFELAKRYVENGPIPIVIKASGLAAGKGALVCFTLEEALDGLKKIMVKKEFGSAGDKVVIEEFLRGEEASILAITDGEKILPLVPAQDHKAILDGDKGPNTGGMGAYAPAVLVDEEMLQTIQKQILEPVIQGMALEGRPYKGVIYAGLMITARGPKVIEFNCRFGDPETQVILPLLKNDLIEIISASIDGRLGQIKIRQHNKVAVCVVMASGGYPGHYEKGKNILGLNRPWDDGLFIFHAGTKLVEDKYLTHGGRVLGITAVGSDIHEAIKKAYAAVGKITFDGAYYRRDIGYKAL
ncbi:MAG: phosphoribosylamine--glycine ligase [Candidatus Zhuqueibacterota bacterium]